MKGPGRSAGFTLLETIIALALLGLIMVLLFSSLRLGSRSWDTGEHHIAESSQRSVIMGFLRRELEQVYPLSWHVQGEDVVAFVGEPSAIAFVGPMPDSLATGGNHMISLGLGQGAEGQDLVLRWHLPTPDMQDFSMLTDADQVVLAKGVQSMSITYFGADGGSKAPSWHDQWFNRQALPALIRIRIRLASGDEWPEIIAAPMITSAGVGVGGPRICILC
jgi:general secretion pathway protein J